LAGKAKGDVIGTLATAKTRLVSLSWNSKTFMLLRKIAHHGPPCKTQPSFPMSATSLPSTRIGSRALFVSVTHKLPNSL